MKLISYMVLVVSLFLVSNAFALKIYELKNINVDKDNPNYEDHVEYNLVMVGGDQFKVSLQKWKRFPLEEGSRYYGALTLVDSLDLFENAIVNIKEPVTINRHTLTLKFRRLLIESSKGSINYDNSGQVERTPLIRSNGIFKSEKLRKFFPVDFNGSVKLKSSFGPSSYLYHEFIGKNNPGIKEVTQNRPGGWGGYIIPAITSFLVLGNNVRSIRSCDSRINNPIEITFSEKEVSWISSRGSLYLEIGGHQKGKCVQLLDEDDNILLQTLLQ